MTPVEPASRPMLPSAFPDGVGLHDLLYGAQSHGPLCSLSTLRPRGRPRHRKTRFQLCLRPWLGGVGYPQGFISRFQLIASSSTRLGWRTRKIGRAKETSRHQADTSRASISKARIARALRDKVQLRDADAQTSWRPLPPLLAFRSSDLPVRKSRGAPVSSSPRKSGRQAKIHSE